MESDRTKVMSATKKKREKTVSDIRSSTIFRVDEMKALEFSYALLIIRCLLPHSLVESDAWREWASLSCKPSTNQRMHAGTVYHRIVELYISLKKIIIAKKRFDLKMSKFQWYTF